MFVLVVGRMVNRMIQEIDQTNMKTGTEHYLQGGKRRPNNLTFAYMYSLNNTKYREFIICFRLVIEKVPIAGLKANKFDGF